MASNTCSSSSIGGHAVLTIPDVDTRFARAEVVLAVLIENFRFEPSGKDIVWTNAGVAYPSSMSLPFGPRLSDLQRWSYGVCLLICDLTFFCMQVRGLDAAMTLVLVGAASVVAVCANTNAYNPCQHHTERDEIATGNRKHSHSNVPPSACASTTTSAGSSSASSGTAVRATGTRSAAGPRTGAWGSCSRTRRAYFSGTGHRCSNPVGPVGADDAVFCVMKLRGPTGKSLPPIWNARRCALSQGRTGDCEGLAAWVVEPSTTSDRTGRGRGSYLVTG